MCQRIKLIPKLQNKALLNCNSGEVHELNCKCWKCAECGPRKAKQLYATMCNFFKDSKAIPLWTFTASSSGLNEVQHSRMMQVAFHHFLKEARRNPILSSKAHKFKYVRILELHKSGFVHYHLLTDKAVPFSALQVLWEHACELAGFVNNGSKFCNVNTRWCDSPRGAARYVVKYVLKAVVDFPAFISRWSKSRSTAISTTWKSTDKFVIFDASKSSLLGFLYLSNYSDKAQNLEVAMRFGTVLQE